jgi:arginine deiminase
METLINHDQLKELLKAALVEVLEERRDLIHDIIEEALEEVALARAIEEGEDTSTVSRDEVFRLLKEQE